MNMFKEILEGIGFRENCELSRIYGRVYLEYRTDVSDLEGISEAINKMVKVIPGLSFMSPERDGNQLRFIALLREMGFELRVYL